MIATPDRRFLVVEPIAAMRSLFRNLLKEMGYAQADEADDGETALAKLKEAPVDFVIAEFRMHPMDGLELLKRVRGDPAFARLPVLLVAEQATRDDVLAAARAGASGCIVKPFTRATLEDRIHAILDRAKAA